MHAILHKARQSIGRLKAPLQIPDHIHYDLWCGPAEKRQIYRQQLHYDWHWDLHTGNGDTGNTGVHLLDVARWFLGEDTPAPRVMSLGGRLGYEDAGDSPNTEVIYHDYPEAPLIFETRGLPRSKAAQSEHWRESIEEFRGTRVGVIVQCEQGHVLAHAFRDPIAYDRQGHIVRKWHDSEKPRNYNKDPEHFTNWLSAVASRNRSSLHADILDGHLSTTLCHTGLISYRLGKRAPAASISMKIAGNDLLSSTFDRMATHLRANGVDIDSGEGAITRGPWLKFNPQAEQFAGNDVANQFLTRDYRAPYAVPDLA